jgi:2-dehydro-3-deoxyphosphooctonate aldolase (KDO 8-P synthase)
MSCSDAPGAVVLPAVAGVEVGGGEVATVGIGGGHPLALIAGPCVIEEPQRVFAIAAALCGICAELGLPLIFKASFDKANRTSLDAYRGPGLEDGLQVLAEVRRTFGVPVTTDVHAVEQVAPAAAAVDLLQVPAFLCRQTDLLVACGASGRPVNVKKGQFLAPEQVRPMVDKVLRSGAPGVVVTERGTTFGHGDLVVDMRGLPRVRAMGVPVCFDATHSVQRPGGGGDHTTGDRGMVPHLARAAAGAGVDAVFLEVHDRPEEARSDGPNMVPLSRLKAVLQGVMAVDAAVRSAP